MLMTDYYILLMRILIELLGLPLKENRQRLIHPQTNTREMGNPHHQLMGFIIRKVFS